MRIVNDYSFLFKSMLGKNKNNAPNLFGSIKVSDLSSKSVKQQLMSAGIDINSKQYKAVASSMMQANENGGLYTNIQAIKNRMSQYDSDGNFTCGGLIVPGMIVNGIPESERHQIIDISETARQDMFDNTKREFIEEYGVANGDTTKRSDVFRRYQLSEKIENRLKGTWTLEQYERMYNRAFVEAVKEADPNWTPGKAFDTNLLKDITRESVESRIFQASRDKLDLKPKNSLNIKV
ncbi:MAG: DUF3879 family protein [Clostridium sp.]|nr:DUF3879 family protein [Clostridium sp.]MCM1547524.1 DUF3879 family protein [Ruminococcus sp.]